MKKPLFYKAAVTVLAMALSLFGGIMAYGQNKTINGKVVDSQGEPIIGASVMVIGNNRVGTVTDMDGAFSLSVPNNANMSVSFIGFKTQTFVVGSQSTYNVVLEEDTEFL